MSQSTQDVAVSFTRISDDVIVPSDLLKWKNNRKSYFRFIIIAFTIIPTALVLFLQTKLFISLFIFFIFCLIATLFLTMNIHWIEINRKQGAINCWTNYRKKKQLPSIRISDADFFYQKVGRGNAYATSVFAIFVKTSTCGKTVEHELHSFPDKTDEIIVKALTKRVSHFINDFMQYKELKPVNKEYRLISSR